MQYAVLDIEATGGKVGTEKIIDIYIYRFDGTQVIDQFGSMVNPERGIDAYVQKLTGITDKMVRRAPKFHELAKRIVEITEDCIIVGHGVDFDYRMLRQEFRELGFKFDRKTLDTLDLSKKLIPEAESHSLGKLTKSLGIPVSSRHTAEGDTRITLELFKILLEKDKQKEVIQSFAIHEPQSKKQISKLLDLEEHLPANTGIFYFINNKKEVFYLAAARNIKQDVNAIFASNGKTEKRLQSQVVDIEYELTGSLLIALLKENEEIKILQNHIQTKKKYMSYGLFADKETKELQIEHVHTYRKQPFLFFHTKRRGHRSIQKLYKQLNLNEIQPFSEQIKVIKNHLKYPAKNMILIDKGRNTKEKSFIEIRNKQLIGYGFYNFYNQLENEEIRKNLLIKISNSAGNKTLIQTFLHFHSFYNVIKFDKNQPVKIQTS